MISIPNTTVWAICWSGDLGVTAKLMRVLRYMRKHAQCERFLLLSAAKVMSEPGIDVVFIPRLTGFQEFNVFVNRSVPKAIRSRYALSVHEDGFPVRWDLWNPEFLNYDYIGAPWPDGVVGNGGFNIESRKLLSEKLRIPSTDQPKHPSDNWICMVNRERLQRNGIRFAPTDVAMRFSTEFLGKENPSFGFHGRICCPEKYVAGWKLIEQSGC